MITDFLIYEQLNQHKHEFPFPIAITNWDVQVGKDSTGDDAIWVWIILNDDLVDQVWSNQIREKMRECVRKIIANIVDLAQVCIYTRFRLESEHRLLT